MRSCRSWLTKPARRLARIGIILLALTAAACDPKTVTEIQTIQHEPSAVLRTCPAPAPRLPRIPPPTNGQMAAWAETAYQGHLACYARVQSLDALYPPDK